MGPLLGLSQIIAGPAGEHLLLEGDILVQDLPQGEDFRLHLVVHQGQQDHAEGGLHLGLAEQAVQGDLGVGVLFQLNDDPHPLLAVGLVPQAGQ